MNCEAYRDALSARLDGEALGMAERVLEAHLTMCVACRQWAASAERLSRRLRVAPAETTPDLSARVVAALAEVGAVGRQQRRVAVLRAALAVVAVTQLCLTVWTGTAGGDFDTPLHVDREAGAWNLALAIGLFAVVWQVRRAEGMLPLLGAVVAVMFAFEVLDLARGHARMTEVLPHLLLVVALVLIALLARVTQLPGGARVRYRTGPPLQPGGSGVRWPPRLDGSLAPAGAGDETERHVTGSGRRRGSERARATRRAGIIGAAAVLGWLVAAALPAPAFAHAELVRTTPVAGQRLEASPSEVVLEFTEQVHLIPNGIRLLHGGTEPMPTGAARVEGTSVILPVPDDLADGGYVVSWRVLSADTHPVAGAFGFGVRADAPHAEESAEAQRRFAPGVQPVLLGGRWVGYAGLALLLGGTVFLLVCWPPGRTLPRARRLVAAGWVAAVAGTVSGLLVQGLYVSGVGWSALDAGLLAETAKTSFGVAHLSRLALFVVLALLVRALLRPGMPSRLVLTTAGLVAAGVVVTYSIAGHAAAGGYREFAIGMDAMHVTGMSMWAGGLVLLVACALRRRHADGLGNGALRFSRLATGSVAVLAVTGTVQAVREVDSLAALTGTQYGRLLLIKLGLVVGLLALGAASMYAVRRSSNTVGRLRRTVPLEIGLISVVLAITAALVVTAPAREAPAMPDPAPGPTQLVLKMPAGGEAELTVEPATVGMNQFTVMVMDAQGHAWHVPEVKVRATLPERELGPFDVHVTADGHMFAGHVDLPLPGTWRIDVTVRTSDIDAYVLTSEIQVTGGKPR